jgi:hypothetical protein
MAGTVICVEGTNVACFCIDRSLLLNAERAEDRMIRDFPDEEPYTLHEAVQDAIYRYVKQFGKLPKPYV